MGFILGSLTGALLYIVTLPAIAYIGPSVVIHIDGGTARYWYYLVLKCVLSVVLYVATNSASCSRWRLAHLFSRIAQYYRIPIINSTR